MKEGLRGVFLHRISLWLMVAAKGMEKGYLSIGSSRGLALMTI